MSQPDRIEFITELVTPLAASLGLAVWGVELGGAARPIAPGWNISVHWKALASLSATI